MSWDPLKHPRHPRGAPAGKGGEFARKSGVEAALMKRIRESGGFTYDPRGEADVSEGYALSLFPERSFAKDLKDLTLNDLTDYVIKNADLLSQKGLMLGGWVDGGKVYIDVSQVEKDKDRAIELALAKDQIGIYDLKKGETIIINRAATSGGVAG